MRQRRVREKNIRLRGEYTDGSEFLLDFHSLTEAREAIPSDASDWVISEIDHPYYPACGRVLDSIE